MDSLFPDISGLYAGDIHIWFIAVNQLLDNKNTYWSILSTDEKSRSSRYIFPIHRDSYIVTHACVRTILSSYLQTQEINIKPADIPINITEYGKPFLDYSIIEKGIWKRQNDLERIDFNLSGTYGLSVLVVSAFKNTGIDIEYIKPFSDLYTFIDKNFSQREIDEIISIDSEYKLESFYRIWCIKEAYIKAIGVGFTKSVKDIVLLPEIKDGKVTTLYRDSGKMRWDIRSIHYKNEYIGAVAREKDIAHVLYLEL